MTTAARSTLADLHRQGTFILANAHDAGSARLLQALGFDAVATTSAGYAGTLGRQDMAIRREELLEHVAVVTTAVDIPVSVDAERGFGDTPSAVAETVDALAEAGAAGCSIEDYNPDSGAIQSVEESVERLEAAVGSATAHGMVITARADNHFHRVDDLDDTIHRLQAYAATGAHCVYAPGLRDIEQITRVVTEVDAPVNVLLYPRGPSVSELAAVGVRRVSVGSFLFHAATKAFVDAARVLATDGILDAEAVRSDRDLLRAAWPAGA
ncbi:isocitrate lyase/PEP mutase family protein [Euzebya tangerina]|uniref:isocitrate lyase/PEP mutase family protein n=1 Tax=Euzebya tangerina TaxID=591198 RepID=UPI000E31F136|nr:isocitrate lyase/phosphoenolpyruvate mutase family protein [Euzebya tangerina]